MLRWTFFVGSPVPENLIHVDFVNDGMAIRYQKATPQMFGEVSRLKTEMGQYKYFEDDTRVVAHDDTVQDIRQNSKAVNRMFWGDKNIQIVALPEKCKGKIKLDWKNYSSYMACNGQSQYYLVLTFRVTTEKQISKTFLNFNWSILFPPPNVRRGPGIATGLSNIDALK